MEKNRKRVWRSFGYTQCDDFAEYLKKMSEQGWQFLGWKGGMIFEKDVLCRHAYAVEVFPDARAEDLRPEEETLEYGEYCQAAGWKLIDSMGKLCVFRKETDDAEPIVSVRERFDNIRKAEKQKRSKGMPQILTLFLLALLWISQSGFSVLIFRDYMLAALCIWVWNILIFVLNFSGFLVWEQRKKRELSEGEIPWYGNRKARCGKNRGFFRGRLLDVIGSSGNFLLFLWTGICGWRELVENGANPGAWAAIAVVVCLAVCGIGLLVRKVVRPGRLRPWAAEAAVLIGVILLFMGIGISTALSIDERQKDPERFETQDGMLTVEHLSEQEGILGKSWSGLVSGSETSGMDFWLWLDRYESESPWILDQIFEEKAKKLKHPKDCAGEWGTERAVCGSWSESGQEAVIFCGSSVIHFQSDQRMDQEKMDGVLESLKHLERQSRTAG